MKENKVQHWILSQREYHEDVAWRSVADPTSINARRRTVIVYSLDDGTTIKKSSFVSFEDSIWGEVATAVGGGRDDGLIAVNIDGTFAFSDGLAAGEHEALVTGLGPSVAARLTRVPMLAMDFIALRAPSMLAFYRVLMEEAHEVIAEAMSTKVITVGVTTCDDVRGPRLPFPPPLRAPPDCQKGHRF